jgi:hypothetical protein
MQLQAVDLCQRCETAAFLGAADDSMHGAVTPNNRCGLYLCVCALSQSSAARLLSVSLQSRVHSCCVHSPQQQIQTLKVAVLLLWRCYIICDPCLLEMHQYNDTSHGTPSNSSLLPLLLSTLQVPE